MKKTLFVSENMFFFFTREKKLLFLTRGAMTSHDSFP